MEAHKGMPSELFSQWRLERNGWAAVDRDWTEADKKSPSTQSGRAVIFTSLAQASRVTTLKKGPDISVRS